VYRVETMLASLPFPAVAVPALPGCGESGKVGRVSHQALLYLAGPEDARAGLEPVAGRPVAFHAIQAARRAGVPRIGVPAALRRTALEQAIRASPALDAVVVWLDPTTPPWAGPLLLLPATVLTSPDALRALLARGPGAVLATAESATAPIGVLDDPTRRALWDSLRRGVPLGEAVRALAPDPSRPGVPGAWLVRVTDRGDARRAAIQLYASLGSPEDSWLDRRLHRPLSRRVSTAAVVAGVTPNQLSGATLAVGLGAAWCFGQATPAAAAGGLALYVLALVLDHADGEVARLAAMESRLGARLDVVVDTIVNAAVVLAMGVSAARLSGAPGWLGPLAAAGVAASAAAARRRVLGAAGPGPTRVRRVLDALGNRDGFYAMLVAFVALGAIWPAALPALLAVVALGSHAYWVGRVAVALRT
jgi:phosphatidylglycerophosphate synthase